MPNNHNLYNSVNAERLALIRQQRADAAKKREEEKAGTPLAIFLSCFIHALKFCSLASGWSQI